MWLFQPKFRGGAKILGPRHAGTSSQGVPETAAENYLEHLLTNERQEGGLQTARFQGNLLLEATGGVPEAALVLRAVGRDKLVNHFADLGDPRLDEALDADLLAHARTVADWGVRACYNGDRSARVTAEPHASAREHLPEAMAQLWKDARRGRVILCDDRAGDLLSGVLSVPLARVPKMNPDRTLSEEGRTVWDQRVLNEGTDPSAHPPALQPRHREVIRMILWWTLKLPGIPILLAKKDISETFKWIWTDTDDVPLFGADIPGDCFGIPGRRITAIYLCLTFGFTGSPGQWMIWAWLTKRYHSSFRPENPEWNDSVAFSSLYVMDDQVLVEPDVGQRTFESNRITIEAMTLLLGPNASNAKEDLEEGAWERRKLIWGLQYDTDLMQLSLPGPKLEKAHSLLSLSEFDYGAEPPPMRLIQDLRSNQQFWLCVMPELAPLFGATDALLARTDAKGRACPKGSPSQQRRSWQDFWEAVELQRVLVTARSQWATRFTNSLAGALTTAERLALPGAAARVVWVTGDATLERITCIDWAHRIALVDMVEPYYESLRKLATASEEGVPPEEEIIIAIAELITYLALASASAEAWQGRLVLYTSDNMNVHQWLESRAAGNALARWLLRVLGALEATHSFRTISAYFRTYHNGNVTADSLTRDKCEEVDELLQRHGLELLAAKPDWALHLDRDWTRRALAWHGQDPGDHQVALQLAERRQGVPLPTTPTPLPVPRPGERFHASEWQATLGTYAVAALSRGAHGSLIPLEGGPRLESSIWPPTIKRNREQDARVADCLLASFAEDPSGEGAKRFALVLSKTGARVFWVDAPAKANLQPLTSLRSEGCKPHCEPNSAWTSESWGNRSIPGEGW